MNDEERRLWVLNDEDLYNLYRSSRCGLYDFIAQNRQMLTEAIERMMK